MTATEEREWWDAHADRVHVWGETGEHAWDDSVAACLPLVSRGLWGEHGALGVRGPVLDLGCGLGRLTIPLAKLFPAVEFVGVDVSPEMLLNAEIAAREAATPNAHFRLGDGRRIPADLDEFAAALCVLVFQHIPADAVICYLYELARVVRPGGRVVCQFVAGPGGGSFLSWSHHALDLVAWASDFGFRPAGPGALTLGHLYPQWAWLTLERAS